MSDLDAVHKLLSDEAAMTYWSFGPHQEVEESRRWLVSMIESPVAASDDFLVEHRGRVIGKLGAWRLPEFGFLFAPDMWGQGFASEALGAFLPYIFTRPEVDALSADVDPRNAASLKLLKRHGFVQTGYRRDTWNTHIGLCDSVYLGLSRAAFLAQASGRPSTT